jgi:DNA-binding MarR family transcriptional regulator
VITAVRAAARLSRVLEGVCQKSDLTLSQYRLLLFIATEPQRFGALADQAALRPPTLTSLVDALEKKGLVERVPVEGDRRALQVALTAEGHGAIDATEAALGSALGPLLDDAGPELLTGLVNLNDALDRAFDRMLQGHAQ